MSSLSRPGPASAAIQWLLKLVTWTLARSLQLPEPLVHSTGIVVFAHVQAVETRAARTLCPVRLLRQMRSWFPNLRR